MPPVRPSQGSRGGARRPAQSAHTSRGGGGRSAAPGAGFDDETQDWPRQVASGALGVAIVAGGLFGSAAFLAGSFKTLPTLIETQVNVVLSALGLGLADVKIAALDVTDRINPRDIGEPIELSPQRLEAIRKALVIAEPGESLFAADPKRLRAAVMGLDFVKDATVLRLWPDQLMVIVETARPVAVLRAGGNDIVIDARGAAVGDLGRAALDHPLEVSGTGAAVAAYGLVKALRERPRLAGVVIRAERIGGRRWDLLIEPSSRVLLPEDPGLALGLETAEKLLLEASWFGTHSRRIDLRIPGKAFVRDLATGFDALDRLEGEDLPNRLDGTVEVPVPESGNLKVLPPPTGMRGQ